MAVRNVEGKNRMLAAVEHRKHLCAPKDWRTTPDISGSYELDAVIVRSRNRDVPDRLAMFVENDSAYGPLTAYNGYRNYTGDS